MKQKLLINLFVSLFVLGFLALSNQVSAATISLSPATGNMTIGSTYDVNVVLNSTGADLMGVDVVLDYNNTQFSVTATAGTSFAFSIGPNVGASQITYTGYNLTAPWYNSASGVVLVLHVTPLVAGPLAITFNQNPTTGTLVSGVTAQTITAFTDGAFTGVAPTTTVPVTTTVAVTTTVPPTTTTVPPTTLFAGTTTVAATTLAATLPSTGIGDGTGLEVKLAFTIFSILLVLGTLKFIPDIRKQTA